MYSFMLQIDVERVYFFLIFVQQSLQETKIVERMMNFVFDC
jgi:hypothetical protein